uniref:BRI3 binding protein n=1 Tax=Naja naja TaxID=35670 RepID=A0A8C6Y8G4_NAJNA
MAENLYRLLRLGFLLLDVLLGRPCSLLYPRLSVSELWHFSFPFGRRRLPKTKGRPENSRDRFQLNLHWPNILSWIFFSFLAIGSLLLLGSSTVGSTWQELLPRQFFSRLTERFVYGVDLLVDTFWRIWTDLLDVLGIDGSNLTHYFSHTALAILLAYWFVSLLLGFFFYLLHVLCGRFFWIIRIVLFALSCVYILQKYESEPEHAVLPLCFVVAVYFMTGPVSFYWRRNSHNTLEEKIDHLESQIRLLNIRLSRVIENLDRGGD